MERNFFYIDLFTKKITSGVGINSTPILHATLHISNKVKYMYKNWKYRHSRSLFKVLWNGCRSNYNYLKYWVDSENVDI